MAKKKAAAEKAKASTYRVRPGNRIKFGRSDDGDRTSETFEPGDEIELTEEEAKRMLHAVEPASDRRRERPGQSARLQRRISELEAEVEELRKAGKPKSPREQAEDDEQREQARESILQRGDNFAARGEPDAQRVPRSVVDAHERAQNAEFVASKDAENIDFGNRGFERMHGDDGQISGADPNRPGDPAKPSQGGAEALEEERRQQSLRKQAEEGKK